MLDFTNGSVIKGLGCQLKMPNGVFLWSPPRCLSTAVECCMRELSCVTEVFHEPYSMPYYFGPERPCLQYASSPVDSTKTFESVTERIKESLLNAENEVVLVKELSYQIYSSSHLDFLEDFKSVKHTFLIRHPALAVRSLYKRRCDKGVPFNQKMGFEEVYKIYEYVKTNLGHSNPVVIDATDILMDPEGMLKLYCEAVGVNYKVGMTKWSQKYSYELLGCCIPSCFGWHDAVFSASGIIKSTQPIHIPPIEELPEPVRETVKNVLPYYEDMKKACLKPVD